MTQEAKIQLKWACPFQTHTLPSFYATFTEIRSISLHCGLLSRRLLLSPLLRASAGDDGLEVGILRANTSVTVDQVVYRRLITALTKVCTGFI
jgi:hypothetical protein